jgi:hypothetical protein
MAMAMALETPTPSHPRRMMAMALETPTPIHPRRTMAMALETPTPHSSKEDDGDGDGEDDGAGDTHPQSSEKDDGDGDGAGHTKEVPRGRMSSWPGRDRLHPRIPTL